MPANVPAYNVNRKVATFGDFSNNINAEKEELKKMKRTTNKNDVEMHQVPGNRTHKFNRITRKIDDLSPAEVSDKIDAIEELEEGVINEGIVDEAEDLESKIKGKLDPRILAHNIHHNPQDFSEAKILSLFFHFMKK